MVGRETYMLVAWVQVFLIGSYWREIESFEVLHTTCIIVNHRESWIRLYLVVVAGIQWR